MPVTSRVRRSSLRRAVVVGSAVAGACLAAAPTGLSVVDELWCGGFVAVLAWFGAAGNPVALLPAAAAATLLAGSGSSLGLGVAAVGVAIVATMQGRASSWLGAVTGGLIGSSLLQGNGPDSRVLATLTTTAIAAAVVGSGLQGLPAARRRQVGRWALGGVAVVVLCGALGGAAVLAARGDADRGIDALRAADRAGTGGDLRAAVADARAAERAFRSAAGPLTTLGGVGRIVPGLAQQLAAADTAMDTAADTARALHRAGSSIDLDGIGLTAGAVDLAKVAATGPPLLALADTTAETVDRLAGIDRALLVGPLSDALDDALVEARDAAATADRIARAVQVLPPLLGQARPTRFLVLFTSPDEARNRFGFLGAFAILRFEAGRLTFERGGPNSLLDRPGATIDQSRLTIPVRAETYLPYGMTRSWRSLTMSPDGPTVADVALQLSAQTDLGPLDGVVLADPTALAGVVGLVGDVPVPGLDVTLTKDTTADFLVRRQYLEFPELGQQAGRKDLLSVVAEEVGRRLAGLSLPSARDLVDTFAPLVDQGHLVVAVPPAARPAAARLFGDVGLDGAFPGPADAGADLLFVGQRNFVGSKIDLFLERRVRYDVTVARGGTLEADLTLDLTNTAPAGGLPAYLIGSAADPPPPLGTNLSTTLIYSRERLTSLTVDGVPVSPLVGTDGGLLVYQVDLTLGPGQRRTIQAHLEGSAGPGPYAFVAYPGGLVHPDDLAVTIHDERPGGGRRSDAFSLVRPSCTGVDQDVNGVSTACHKRV